MLVTSGHRYVQVDNNVKLSRLVQREHEALRFSKESYDMEFPHHARHIPHDLMRRLAVKSVLQRICKPECAGEDSFV
ncbi:MAG: hypothetical protein NTW27_06135 [Deltaproteobacteria bacterium]|nr:hypothetical protein [Deltaproteobacteria bacterium]